MEVFKNSIYWKFQRSCNTGTWFKILKIHFALICASCHLACVSRAIWPPQVVFCLLQILLEFLVSKHENIFLLHGLIQNINSGILRMVFCYMLLLFIWQCLGSCPLSGHNFLQSSALSGWCRSIILLAQPHWDEHWYATLCLYYEQCCNGELWPVLFCCEQVEDIFPKDL